jgi:hypothetical protein
MKTISILLSALLLAGCATAVSNRNELIGNIDLTRKDCYTYDTVGRGMARNMPSTAALGLLGGLFPPLAIVTALAAGGLSAADQASLPAKCGITYEEARKSAIDVAYYEKATATWSRKDGKQHIVAKYVSGEDCAMIDVAEIMDGDGNSGKKYKEQLQVCRNENGEAAITPKAP